MRCRPPIFPPTASRQSEWSTRASCWRSRDGAMKLLRGVLLFAIVLAAVAGVAAWTCPADFAYRYFGDRLAPLALHDLSGTIWQGRAAAVELFRQNLGALEWRLQPAPLLHGCLLYTSPSPRDS